MIFEVTSSPLLLNGTVRKHRSNYNFDCDFSWWKRHSRKGVFVIQKNKVEILGKRI